jgi:hypothetical protein
MVTKFPPIEFIVTIRKKLQLIYKKKSLEVFFGFHIYRKWKQKKTQKNPKYLSV